VLVLRMLGLAHLDCLLSEYCVRLPGNKVKAFPEGQAHVGVCRI
jgi:hypothetical protein